MLKNDLAIAALGGLALAALVAPLQAWFLFYHSW